MLILDIMMLILMLLILNTDYADTDADFLYQKVLVMYILLTNDFVKDLNVDVQDIHKSILL